MLPLARLALLLPFALLAWMTLHPAAPVQAAAFSARISFQPVGAPVPAGYLVDSGSTYGSRGNGYSYGWSGNTTAYTVDRNDPLSPDQRYDTLNHMQWYGTFTWEIGVPNGRYSVRVVAGDPWFWDSTYRLTAEGAIAVDGTPNSNHRWLDGTVVVTVSDGRLTLGNATGSFNNKIAFIDITSLADGTTMTKVNFQPTGAPVPGGYLVDSGATYGNRGNGQIYGWSGDTTPYTVDRNDPLSPDQRYDTVNHMQWYGAFFWEIAVPNGTYSVRVVSGDPWFWDSVYKISVEGVLAVNGTPTAAARWLEGTAEVLVSDGRITIANSSGSVNNKIDFVEIASLDSPGNDAPSAPTITEPLTDGQVVHPADVHMETASFFDGDAGDTHTCSEWQILLASTAEVVWAAPPQTPTSGCGVPLTHSHLGDGTFLNSHAGRSDLLHATNYRLRIRHRDSSGVAATQWSSWAERSFRTSAAPAPGTPVAWTLRQTGYAVEVFATGLALPVNIAFVPNPGSRPSDPYLYVTELYGTIKVVSRDGTVSDYIRDLVNYRPNGSFPGSGEQGLTGIVVDRVTGDVFAGMLYLAADGNTYPKVMRFRSNHDGRVSNNFETILDMAGESQRESHQISNLSIGPDDKLYVHVGDGFDVVTAQNLNSYRGKVLRMNLDGSAVTSNPFYNAADGISARDYVFAYGFRNPFGGAWRGSDNMLYSVENGPSVDRLIKITGGRNYLWDGSDTSMRNWAIFNWEPSVAPVNIAFIQSQTFSGSLFPADKLGHAFVSESGPTYATGPQVNGKRISEFVLDAAGNRVSGPTPLLEYTGTGRATVAGLTAGPDGLYFTDLYKDQNATSPTQAGANILRIRYVGASAPVGTFSLSGSPSSKQIRRGQSTTYTIQATPSQGFMGNVSLGVSGLPAGASSTLSPNPVVINSSSSQSSTLRISTSSATPLDDYQLTVTASSGAIQKTTTVVLRVKR